MVCEKQMLQKVLRYEWIQDCLKQGHLLPSKSYELRIEPINQGIQGLQQQSDVNMNAHLPGKLEEIGLCI